MVGHAFLVRTVCVLSNEPAPLNCLCLVIFVTVMKKSNQLTRLVQVCEIQGLSLVTGWIPFFEVNGSLVCIW